MITTKDIDAKTMRSKSRYKIKTTKEIDATLPYDEKPKVEVKKEMVTTHNIEEFSKAAMAKKRMAKARAAKKGKKK